MSLTPVLSYAQQTEKFTDSQQTHNCKYRKLDSQSHSRESLTDPNEVEDMTAKAPTRHTAELGKCRGASYCANQSGRREVTTNYP